MPPESVLHELCTVNIIAGNRILDHGQCHSHRIRVLFVFKFGVSCSESRSSRCNDARQLMLGNSRRDGRFRKSEKLP